MYIYKYIKKFTTLINSKVKIFLLYFYVIFVALNFYYKVNKQIIMRKTITFIMFLLFSASIISGQTSNVKDNPVGKWKFEAPLAPEGYNLGTIDIAFAGDKYSTTISFAGSDYKIPGENTKVEKDSVAFVVYIEGDNIAISLKAENDTKMTGKAVYSQGEIPLTLTREPEKK